MQTPKQMVNIGKLDGSSDVLGIVPPECRTCTVAEWEKIVAEVNAEHTAELQSRKGIRLWWLKWRLKRKIEARVEELEGTFKEGI